MPGARVYISSINQAGGREGRRDGTWVRVHDEQDAGRALPEVGAPARGRDQRRHPRRQGRSWVITPTGQGWVEWFEGAGVSDDVMSDRGQPAEQERDSL